MSCGVGSSVRHVAGGQHGPHEPPCACAGDGEQAYCWQRQPAGAPCWPGGPSAGLGRRHLLVAARGRALPALGSLLCRSKAAPHQAGSLQPLTYLQSQPSPHQLVAAAGSAGQQGTSKHCLPRPWCILSDVQQQAAGRVSAAAFLCINRCVYAWHDPAKAAHLAVSSSEVMEAKTWVRSWLSMSACCTLPSLILLQARRTLAALLVKWCYWHLTHQSIDLGAPELSQLSQHHIKGVPAPAPDPGSPVPEQMPGRHLVACVADHCREFCFAVTSIVQCMCSVSPTDDGGPKGACSLQCCEQVCQSSLCTKAVSGSAIYTLTTGAMDRLEQHTSLTSCVPTEK